LDENLAITAISDDVSAKTRIIYLIRDKDLLFFRYYLDLKVRKFFLPVLVEFVVGKFIGNFIIPNNHTF
jgi:hypothetical protein